MMSTVVGSQRPGHQVDNKNYLEGTHRTRAPVDTLVDFWPKAPSMGITRLANVTGLDWVGIPVYNAIRPNSRSLSVSQGKGFTPEAAKVSALMESVEYWHAEHLTVPLRHESYFQLIREGNVINVDDLPRRAGLDSSGPGPRETPAQAIFEPDIPVLWLEGHELLGDRATWLPYETVRLNKVGLDYSATTFRVASNGLAAGNTTAEAIVHGICELVERDALTLWWQSVRTPADAQGTKLDLDSVDDEVCRSLLDQLRRANLDVAVWDVTSDIAVPAYQCCLIERSDRAVWRPFGPCWGYGAHLSHSVALARALTEAAQSRVTVIAASRDDNFPSQYESQNDPGKQDAVRRFFFSSPGRLSFGSRSGLATDTTTGDLDVLMDNLRISGITAVVAVDLSKPDIGIPTVKMVIPGLEFFSLFIGYSPGGRALRARARQRKQTS